MTTEKFHYTHKGKTITLPHFRHLPFGLIRKLRKQGDGEELFGLIEAVADKKSLDVIDTMDMGEVGQLFEAWQEASSVTLGESGASSTD